jgi:hypothetical protein
LHLSGNIPDDFVIQKPGLSLIQLTCHAGEGTIPASLYEPVSLEKIDFHSNSLQGTLSESIGNLLNLTNFSAAKIKLDGTPPRSA